MLVLVLALEFDVGVVAGLGVAVDGVVVAGEGAAVLGAGDVAAPSERGEAAGLGDGVTMFEWVGAGTERRTEA